MIVVTCGAAAKQSLEGELEFQKEKMSNSIVQATSHGSNGLLFAGWNQDQGKAAI